jgi:hypothetical protein
MCSICTHPARSVIEAALRDGTPQRAVAVQFGMSKSAIARHAKQHMLLADDCNPVQIPKIENQVPAPARIRHRARPVDSASQQAHAARLRLKGLSDSAIARELEIPESTVTTMLAQADRDAVAALDKLTKARLAADLRTSYAIRVAEIMSLIDTAKRSGNSRVMIEALREWRQQDHAHVEALAKLGIEVTPEEDNDIQTLNRLMADAFQGFSVGAPAHP